MGTCPSCRAQVLLSEARASSCPQAGLPLHEAAERPAGEVRELHQQATSMKEAAQRRLTAERVSRQDHVGSTIASAS